MEGQKICEDKRLVRLRRAQVRLKRLWNWKRKKKAGRKILDWSLIKVPIYYKTNLIKLKF